jgi:hypothetical protein
MDADGGHEAGTGAGGEPIEPIELFPAPTETRVVTRGPRRRHLVVAGVAGVAVVAVVAAAAAVVLLAGDDGTDPDEALQAAQEVVERSESFTFEQLAETSVSLGDPDGTGSDTTTRTLLTGTVAAPDRWHVVQDVGDLGFGEDELLPEAFETIRIGDDLYSTGFPFMDSDSPGWVAVSAPDEAFSEAELGAMWDDAGYGDDDDPYLDEMRLGVAIQAYLFDATGDPAAVSRVVTELTEPVVEEQRGDGGVVLRARLAPAPELAELGDVPPVDAVLHLDVDGRPVSVRFTAASGSATADVQVTFSAWGSAPDIEAPPEADVDRTPWIAEGALSTLDPALLVAPTALPPTLELVSATVFDPMAMFGELGDEELGDVFGEGDLPESCPALTLSYASEGEVLAGMDPEAAFEDMTYLDVTVTTPACSPLGMFEELTFDDELGGYPASGGDGFWEVQVGDALLSFASTLGDDELAPIVASIQPTSADALIAAIPEWVADAPSMGGLYGFTSPMTYGFGLGGMFPGG